VPDGLIGSATSMLIGGQRGNHWSARKHGARSVQGSAPEAVDAEIAIKLTGAGDIHRSSRLRVELPHQFAHNSERARATPRLEPYRETRLVGLLSWRMMGPSASLLFDADQRACDRRHS
jgi:hypothetical protein